MNIQIDSHLFLQVWTYFFDMKNRSPEEQEIFEALDAKADRMISRELFSRFKRAATEEERNAARLEYMQHINTYRR